MTRTKGAKGKPKEPGKELAKVKALYAERGLPWPPAGPIGQAGEETTFALGDIPLVADLGPGHESYKCGNCQAALPGELPVCPECGATLRWT